jgi:acyl carrier protein
MNEIKDQLREIFVKALRLQIAPDQVGNENLVSQLGIDSINSLEILIWVEDAFKISIEDEDLSPRLVDSLESLASYIVSRKEQRTST